MLELPGDETFRFALHVENFLAHRLGSSSLFVPRRYCISACSLVLVQGALFVIAI